MKLLRFKHIYKKIFGSEALVVMKLPEWVEELNQIKVISRRHKNKWDTQIKKEIQVTTRTRLLNFLQMFGDLPKIDLGIPTSRGVRLVVSRSVKEAQQKKRKVVMVWWQWSYTREEIYSNHWIKLPFLQQNQIKLYEEIHKVNPHGRTALG